MTIDEVPFADLLAHVVDNRGRTCPTGPTGRPLIATNCVTNDRLYPAYDTERAVSDETYRTWFRGHPLPGDLIFVCKGAPGRVALAPDPVDFCIAQDMVALRADPKRVYTNKQITTAEMIVQLLELATVNGFGTRNATAKSSG